MRSPRWPRISRSWVTCSSVSTSSTSAAAVHEAAGPRVMSRAEMASRAAACASVTSSRSPRRSKRASKSGPRRTSGCAEADHARPRLRASASPARRVCCVSRYMSLGGGDRGPVWADTTAPPPRIVFPDRDAAGPTDARHDSATSDSRSTRLGDSTPAIRPWRHAGTPPAPLRVTTEGDGDATPPPTGRPLRHRPPAWGSPGPARDGRSG